MAYSLEDLIAKLRLDLEDTVEPYLWSDEEFKEYLDEAQDDYMELTDSTPDVIALPYIATDDYVDLPRYVTRVRRAKAPSGRSVTLYNEDEWEEAIITDDYGDSLPSTQWETTTGPEPSSLITDFKADQVRLYPIPTVDGALTLRVYRVATQSPIDDAELEITDNWGQNAILLKTSALAYGKHDSEVYNPQLAADFERQYMGKVERQKRRVTRRRRRSKAVMYGGL